jgi:hypothetical protein
VKTNSPIVFSAKKLLMWILEKHQTDKDDEIEEDVDEKKGSEPEKILLTFDGKTVVSADVAVSNFGVFVTCQLPLAVFAERRPDEPFWQWNPSSKYIPTLEIPNPRDFMIIGELLITEDGCILLGNGQPTGTRVPLDGIRAALFATCLGDIPTPYKNQQCWISDPHSTDTGMTPPRKKKEIVKKEKVVPQPIEKRPRNIPQDTIEKTRIKKKDKVEVAEEPSISIKYKFEGESDADARLIKSPTAETSLTPQMIKHLLEEDNVVFSELSEVRFWESSEDESCEGWVLLTEDFRAPITGKLRFTLRLKKRSRRSIVILNQLTAMVQMKKRIFQIYNYNSNKPTFYQSLSAVQNLVIN